MSSKVYVLLKEVSHGYGCPITDQVAAVVDSEEAAKLWEAGDPAWRHWEEFTMGELPT
jgi:uncharacterized membrane protein